MKEYNEYYEQDIKRGNGSIFNLVLFFIAFFAIIIGAYIIFARSMWTAITFPLGIAFLCIGLICLRVPNRDKLAKYVGIAFLFTGIMLLGIGVVIAKAGLYFFLKYGIPTVTFIVFGALGGCFLVHGIKAKDKVFVMMGVSFLVTALVCVAVGVVTIKLLAE